MLAPFPAYYPQEFSLLCRMPLELPDLNTYININRRNRFGGATLKRNTDALIRKYLPTMPAIEERVFLLFAWKRSNKRKDPDNVAFAKKFVLDALQKSGILVGDSPKYVAGFADVFEYCDENALEVWCLKTGEYID